MKSRRRIDPRTGLFLLVLANATAFLGASYIVEISYIGMISVLLMSCICVTYGIKWLAGFLMLLILQRYILPVSPKLIATSFSIFVNYARRMFPCLMIGILMIKTISLREFIVGLRKLKAPQKLIIPISVTLRYFPAIREETGYIRDAMRLRNIRGLKKIEALTVPLMISATETAEELSAAAVTRGIEDPALKTSMIELRMGMLDVISIIVGFAFLAASVLV